MAAQESKKRRQLLQQAEKILLHPIHPHLITYCPTMDLVAIVTDEENLDVYRINGQRAFGLKRKSEDVSVDALQWEFNGKSIAVSWSDGSTDLVNAETGKVSHKDLMLPILVKDGNSMVEEELPPRVKCMGWGLNFIDVVAVQKRTGVKQRTTNGSASVENDAFGQPTTEDWDAFKDDTTVEDFLQRQPDFQALDIAPDLPDQLAMMDVESLLPKLPAIPLPPALPFMRVSAADTGSFSTQVEVDALLHSHHLKDHNSVDMFIRCSDRGTIHPSLYDSLETVDIHLPAAWNLESTPLLHASHPYSCSHALLMRTREPTSTRSQIAFVPLTLNFIPSAGIYLHLIASKTSQLQNLLLYITQCLQRVRTYFKHGSDLPSKFMMNISEILEEKGQGELTTNLFHIACTGNCPPLIREWLVDELAEQGHKRWDNTVTTSLTTLLALIHENLIPAIDRCSIIISRLRGLAQFHDQTWIFTSPITDFSALLEMLKNMRLLAHTVLLYAGEEKRQFQAFSKWLRFVIDFEATEPDSQSRSEMEGRDPGVDIHLVLDYIQFSLGRSNLQPYLRPEAQLDAGVRGKNLTASYEDTKKAIEVLKGGGQFKEEALCLEHVLNGYKEGLTGLLRQVSKWQEKNIQMDSGIVLEDVENEKDDMVMDIRMVFEPPSKTSTYIALSLPSNASTLHIHRLSSLTSTPTHSTTTLTFPPNTFIHDAKFADDTNLLVLLHIPSSSPSKKNTTTTTTTTLILKIPYTTPPSPLPTPSLPSSQPTPQSPLYTTTPPTSLIKSHSLPKGHSIPFSKRGTTQISMPTVEKWTRHVFEGGRFVPSKMVVNGRRGRRVIVVLGRDGRHYRVLDMDFREGRKGDGEGEDDESEVSGSGSGSDDEDGGEDVEMGGA